MAAEFIPVSEARQLIETYTDLLQPASLPLSAVSGLALAEDVLSKTDVPPFNQSSMDGYAFNFDGWKQHGTLTITGSVAAGLSDKAQLEPHQASRIFTGAAVPDGADTIVMQEKTKVEGKQLTITDIELVRGSNYRSQGSESKSGSLAVEAGTRLSPAAIGFMACVGIAEVSAYPNPTVAIILTGNELQAPGLPLNHGQVYESNSFSLSAALNYVGIQDIKLLYAKDELETLTAVLAEALASNDMVLLTGGVSVGDYDFVIRAAQANEVIQVFHKVRQKPGKPLFFGKKGKQVVFGLPGNPASVLNCFYEYVLPCIGKMTQKDLALKSLVVPLGTDVKKPVGLTQFLKGYYDGSIASDLKAQESFRLSSFAKANCLIRLEEGKASYAANELVEIHLLPE